MATYAASTEVSSEKSRAEIERTLTRYGATNFAYAWQDNRAMIGFGIHGRQLRMVVSLPDRSDPAFRRTPARGQLRSQDQQDRAWEQAVRQRWRALALVVKAKLEAVEAGVTTFEQEWAMFMTLPNGRTVADEVLPAIDRAYATGHVGTLLQIANHHPRPEKSVPHA